MKFMMGDSMSTEFKEAQPWFAPTGEILVSYLNLFWLKQCPFSSNSFYINNQTFIKYHGIQVISI